MLLLVKNLTIFFLLFFSLQERRLYLGLTARILFSKKNKLAKQWSETEINQFLSLLNEKLLRFVTIQEMDEANLVFIFDIIFNLISVPLSKFIFLYC